MVTIDDDHRSLTRRALDGISLWVAAFARRVTPVQAGFTGGVLSEEGNHKKEIPMGVVTISRFETQAGHAAKHLELHMEALGRLRGLGMQAMALQPLAGVTLARWRWW